MYTRNDLDLGKKLAGDITSVIRQELSFETDGKTHPMRYFASKLADQFGYFSRRAKSQACDRIGAAVFEGIAALGAAGLSVELFSDERYATGALAAAASIGLGAIAANTIRERNDLESQARLYDENAKAIRRA